MVQQKTSYGTEDITGEIEIMDKMMEINQKSPAKGQLYVSTINGRSIIHKIGTNNEYLTYLMEKLNADTPKLKNAITEGIEDNFSLIKDQDI